MKKVFVLMLSLILSLGCFAAAESYSPGWYSLRDDAGFELSLFYLPDGSSVSMPDSMTLSPAEVKGFTAGSGIYTVGDDIPPGKYSLSATDVKPGYVNYRIYDADGGTLLGGVLQGDAIIGNIDLKEGYVVKLEDGATHFVPSSGGIVFD